MSERRIITSQARVYEFVRQYQSVPLISGMKAVGLERDGELIAGVLYEGHSGPNVWMHVAAKPSTTWATPEFLATAFGYAFDQLQVARVSGYVEASNKAAVQLDERLGFKPEAVLSGAAADGGDVILYVMWRKDCKYV